MGKWLRTPRRAWGMAHAGVGVEAASRLGAAVRHADLWNGSHVVFGHACSRYAA